VSENRSGTSVVQSALGIKRWRARLPTVEETRPACCPSCEAASCPVGGPIQLHGHGTRARQVRGPGGPLEPAETVEITARRYRCVPCGAVVVVVPSEVVAGRLYSASAIGLALALWGLVLATAARVRRLVCPAKILGHTAVTGWATLRRWARDVAQGKLFPSVPGAGPSASLRGVAASAASALAARADPTSRELAIERRAFLGAAHAA
jgi:hypothetical protein